MVFDFAPAASRLRLGANFQAVCLAGSAANRMRFIVPFCKSGAFGRGRTTILASPAGRLRRKSAGCLQLPAAFILDDDQTMTG